MEEKPKKQRRKKKPNKHVRARIKAEKADEYNVAFTHGYNMGYAQGILDERIGKVEHKNKRESFAGS